MAQETEVVVFEVDVSSYEKSLADLTKSINGLKDAQADLQKQTKNGAKGAAESLEKVNAQLKLQQQEYRTTQNVLVGYIGAKQKEVNVTDFSKNSIQANRDLLKQLTAQYITTVKPTQDFTDKIKNLSDELKKQEGAIGDTRRNVGNYFNEFAKGVPQLGAAVDGIKMVNTAFKDAGGGVAGFSAALATTGLPLIIAGMNLLIDAFKDFVPLAESVEDIMGGLSAAFTSSYAEGVKVVQLKRQLEENDRNQIVTNAELKKSINELEAIAANKAAKDKDRITALEGANKLREQQLANDKEDAKNQLELINLQVKQAEESAKAKAGVLTALGFYTQGKVNSDLLKRQQEANAKLVELDDQFNQQTISNSNKIAQLKQSIQDEQDKKDSDRAQKAKERRDKAQADAEKSAQAEIARLNKLADENERLEQLRIETLEKGLQKEEDLYKLAFEKKIPDLIKAGLTEQQITEAQQQGLTDVRAKYAAEQVKIEKKKNEEIKQSDAQLNFDLNQSLLDNQKKQEDAIIKTVTEITNAISGILSAVSALINQTTQDNIDSLAEQAKMGTITQKQFAAETRELKLKAWKESKAIAITQAVMNTANAVMAQLSNPTPYVGIVLAALAAATGAIQIATIAKQKPPKFAKGGKVIPIDGRSHSDGGTPIHVNGQHVAEAEKGEGLFIMKRDAYQDINMLSGWNQKYGGNNWTGKKVSFAADGGGINIPTSDGGFATREIKSTVDNAFLMKQAIKDGFSSAPAPELSIVELNRKQTSRNRSVDVVNL